MQQPLRIRFTPVQLKVRHDGWTPARQLRFIEVLAATRSIAKACRAVGMSRESAYKLRDRPDARQFRLAWHDALQRDCDRQAHRQPSPKLTRHGQPTPSALEALRTYLAELHANEQRLRSRKGG